MKYECAVLQLNELDWERAYEGAEHAESPEEAARDAAKEALLTLHVSAGVQVDDSATKTLRKAARWEM